MRPFEWLLAVIVLVIGIEWLRGHRPPIAIGAIGLVLVVLHWIFEGQRFVMWAAYAVVFAALIAGARPPLLPRTAGVGRRIGRGIGFLLVVLLGIAVPWLWPVMKLPNPTGRYAIGTTWIVVRDSTRQERFGAERGGVRSLPVKLWYPVAPGTTGERARYAEPEEPSAVGMIPRVLNEQVALIRTHALIDAPIDRTERFPVVIFSHGYTGYTAQNTPQMEELASHGYVVASIAHTGEASWTPFPGGKGIPIDTSVLAGMRRMAKEMGAKTDTRKAMDSTLAAMGGPDPAARLAALRSFIQSTAEPLRSESVAEWSLDTKATVDVLALMDGGSIPSLFAGRFDLNRIGISGMSYGGATAGEFCARDRRCKVAVNIDGGQYGRLIDDSLMVPLLIIASDAAYGAHLPVLDLTRGPAFLARVPATNHIGLTDMSLQAPSLYRWLGMTGKLDPDRREDIMTAYFLAFVEKYLAGRNPEQFDGLAAKFPEVTLVSRNQTEPKP